MHADTYRHILGLRAVRAYLADPIPPEEVAAILEAGRWTGSSKNLQDWAFVVLDDEGGRRRLASAGRFAAPVAAAPLAIAIVRLPKGNDFDVGRAAQNMMLAAAARGIASCPVTLHDDNRASEALGLPPDHRCRYAIAFGYPDREAEDQRREERRAGGWGGRKPISELVHDGRFGRE